MSEAPVSTGQTQDTLPAGDALARGGDWTRAVDVWDRAFRRDPSMRDEVERRLTWLLTETGNRPNPIRSRTTALVIVFVVAALLAAVFVAVAGTPGTPAANAWATAAWVMIVVSAVASVVAARGTRPESIERLLDRSRRAAAKMDANPEERKPTNDVS